MKVRKLRRNLAISTIVANMMMITITLSLAAILVAWAGTTYGTFSSGSQLYFAQRGQALQERFVIEFANSTGGATHKIDIFVRNVGVEEIRVVGIYVNGTLLTPNTGLQGRCTYDTAQNPPSTLITIGQVCDFNVTFPSTWSTGTVLYITVASARGNQATYTARGA